MSKGYKNFLLLWAGVGADGLGALTGKGVGRGAAIMIFISGILLAVTVLTLLRLPEIKELEKIVFTFTLLKWYIYIVKQFSSGGRYGRYFSGRR